MKMLTKWQWNNIWYGPSRLILRFGILCFINSSNSLPMEAPINRKKKTWLNAHSFVESETNERLIGHEMDISQASVAIIAVLSILEHAVAFCEFFSTDFQNADIKTGWLSRMPFFGVLTHQSVKNGYFQFWKKTVSGLFENFNCHNRIQKTDWGRKRRSEECSDVSSQKCTDLPMYQNMFLV